MLARQEELAEVLGVAAGRRQSPVQLIERIESGLPVSSLDRVAHAIAPGDAEFKHRFVARATLARRRHSRDARLTGEESERLARVARVWAHALDVWQDAEAARAFLFGRHPMLEQRRPIDVALANGLGADLVDQILGGLEYGTAA